MSNPLATQILRVLLLLRPIAIIISISSDIAAQCGAAYNREYRRQHDIARRPEEVSETEGLPTFFDSQLPRALTYLGEKLGLAGTTTAQAPAKEPHAPRDEPQRRLSSSLQ